MIMEEKRAEALSKFLTEDTDRAKELLSLEPEKALAKINAEGFDFTLDEILEFGEQVRLVSSLDEISEANLELVSGGVVGVITMAFVGTVCFAVGQRIGKYAPW